MHEHPVHYTSIITTRVNVYTVYILLRLDTDTTVASAHVHIIINRRAVTQVGKVMARVVVVDICVAQFLFEVTSSAHYLELLSQ